MPRITSVVSVRLTPEDRAFLLELAEREDRKPGETIRWLIRREKKQSKSKELAAQPQI